MSLTSSGPLPADNVFVPLLRSVHATNYRDFEEQVQTTNKIARAAGQSDEYIETINTFIYALQNIRKSYWFESGEIQEVTDMVARGFPTWEQEFVQQGIERGIERGIEQGSNQTSRSILIRLLQQRFGDLGDDVEARVENADQLQLDQWLNRVVVVTNLHEVFK